MSNWVKWNSHNRCDIPGVQTSFGYEFKVKNPSKSRKISLQFDDFFSTIWGIKNGEKIRESLFTF